MEQPEKKVKIGKFILEENGYAEKFWIYTEEYEGMALSNEQTKEFEELIEKFYKEHF